MTSIGIIETIIGDLESYRRHLSDKSPNELVALLPSMDQLGKLRRLIREINEYALYMQSHTLTKNLRGE